MCLIFSLFSAVAIATEEGPEVEVRGETNGAGGGDGGNGSGKDETLKPLAPPKDYGQLHILTPSHLHTFTLTLPHTNSLNSTHTLMYMY